MIGLVLVACTLPLLSLTRSYRSAIAFFLLGGSAMALVITPSLAYMAEATSSAGVGSFGVGYGLYNMAWGAGLLGGPALGGFLFERIGFRRSDAGVGASPAGRHVRALESTISDIPLQGARMKRVTAVSALTLVACLLSTPSIRADVRADEKIARRVRRHARPHGEHLRRQGGARRHDVDGRRQRRPQGHAQRPTTGQIIDLGEEKIYDLDLKRKSYTVTTFAELRRRMEEAQEEGGRERAERAAEGTDQAGAGAAPKTRSRSTST